MTEALSVRQHIKRHPGITQNIHNTLFQAKKHSQDTDFVAQLMQNINSPPKRTPKVTTLCASNAFGLHQHPESPQNNVIHHFQRTQAQLSVSRHMRALLQPPSNQIKRVLSADKASLAMNTPRAGRLRMLHTTRMLARPPAALSKKSTGTSTQSEEEALREENRRIRELCAAEESRLVLLQRQIEDENRLQLIRRQLYEQSIKKLKRMAGETDQEAFCSTQELNDDCDNLSVTSR